MNQEFVNAHIGLNVKDLNKSLEFYVNLLGFREISSIQLEDGTRIAFIELPEQFVIELVENSDQPKVGDGPWNHFCMRVKSFDESYCHLCEKGIVFETDKMFFSEFWDHGMKFAFFRGPDGERLEIAEF